MTMHSRNYVLLLVLFNVLLLLLMVYEVLRLPLQQQAAEVIHAVASEEPLLPHREADIPRTIRDYDEVIARPLFNKDRRAVVKEADAVIQEETLPFSLVGVVLTAEQQVAIIYSENQKQPVKLALWEWVDGWRLVSVEAQGVGLRKGNRTVELALQRTSGAGAKVK